MPEGEPSQFDPQEPIDETVEPSNLSDEPTTETEPSLEQLKDPKYWEQEFQKSWERKAGQEKNWSGLKMMYISSLYYVCNLFHKKNQKVILPDKMPLLISDDGESLHYSKTKPLEMKNSFTIPIEISGIYKRDFHFPLSVFCTNKGQLYVGPIFSRYIGLCYQVWSSPFYAGYWAEKGSFRRQSLDEILTEALNDITSMDIQRIADIQIEQAIKIFLENYSNPKSPKQFFEYTEAFRTGFQAWRDTEYEKFQEVASLPRPADTPGPSKETLPRPVNPDEENSSSGSPLSLG